MTVDCKLHAKGGATADIVKTESAKALEGGGVWRGGFNRRLVDQYAHFGRVLFEDWNAGDSLELDISISMYSPSTVAASPAAEDVHPGQRVSPSRCISIDRWIN